MSTFGSPIKHGTLGSVIFGILLILVLTYFYLTSQEREPPFLILILLGSASTIGSYYQYKKLKRQEGGEFRGDSE
jgi:hypothetical protein